MDWVEQRLQAQRAETPPAKPAAPESSGSSFAAGLFWFLAFGAIGTTAVAAAALLPEYAALATLRARRDALAHHVACERKLVRYNDRLIAAMRRDPVLTARLLIRYANYAPPGCRELPVDDDRAAVPTPVRIMREAACPPAPPDDLAVRAGRWLSHRGTRTGLVLLGLGIITIGWVLFAVPPERRRSGRV